MGRNTNILQKDCLLIMEFQIVIIGDPLLGRSALETQAIANADFIHAVYSPSIEPVQQKVFKISRLPEFKEPWIDPNEPLINYKKHKKTCAKNRKNRKRR
jgi:hypothetical protein